MTEKILDSVILIRLLVETEFKDLFIVWVKNDKYLIYIPNEVYNEINKGKEVLNSLISANIIQVLPDVPSEKLMNIKKKYGKLSKADSAVFFYGELKQEIICLTDDGPLRKALKGSGIRTSGTKGIYKKLKEDNSFDFQKIESHFAQFKKNPRIFPD